MRKSAVSPINSKNTLSNGIRFAKIALPMVKQIIRCTRTILGEAINRILSQEKIEKIKCGANKMGQQNKLSELFSVLQTEMIAKANLSTVLSHPTDRGDNLEQSWIDWFNTYLPKRYKANKATIIDSNGNVSDQIDLVLYDAQYSYLAFNQNGVLYIPAESVYAVFEVKQDISKEHMEYAGKKAESARILERTSAAIPYAGGIYPPKPLHRIIAGILAARSSWKEPFSKPFLECLKSFSVGQQIDCGCVLGCGAFHCDYDTKILKTSDHNESLVFFYLQLLLLLQTMGTVPAIDFNKYMTAITSVKKVNT